MVTRQSHRRQGGAALLIFALLLVMGALTYFLSNLSPDVLRAQKTSDALAQAREALIGYAVQYREQQIATGGTNDAMYGFLPMPDVGTSRLNVGGQTPDCATEGCAMSFINGAFPAATETIIGRLPWRTLGIAPLRDGHGECLWYIVSAGHKNLGINPALPMNWDALGQLDVVIASGNAALTTAITNAHDRPVAIIFSPGPPLPGQDRSASAADNVTECGGNYAAANYLDPGTTALGDTTNYLAGTNQASGNDAIKSLSTQGTVQRNAADGTLWANACPAGGNCAIAANDVGLSLTSDALFGAFRKSSHFRLDINSMLDNMVSCLRDQVVAGTGFTPMTLANPSVSSSKAAGRIHSHSCFDDTLNTAVNPKGYFTHYRDQVFVAACPGAVHNVVMDVVPQNCAGALIFAGQRKPTQSRATADERIAASNYLEDDIASNGNLAGLTALQSVDYAGCTLANAQRFAGPKLFASLASGQTAQQDIVRCIPVGASLAVVAPTVAVSTFAGSIQLADYSAAARTLTLGSADISSNYGAAAASLFACAWTPETHAGDSGFRSYFRFRVRRVGEGFTFAVIDGDRNGTDVCGAARQHLGYSGDNGATPYIQAPKLAVEFDTARNRDFDESLDPLRNGRNDPCYQSSCGSTQNLQSNAHIAVVYWGHETPNPTIPVTLILQDDNVHGFPLPPDTSLRPAPRNPYPILPFPTPAPDPAPGVAPLDRMGATSPLSASAKREFHARVEVTRTFVTPADAKDGVTGVTIKFWIEPHSSTSISAMTYNAGSPPTLTVTATSHGYNTGDVVVIKDAVPTGYNGKFPIAVIDADTFTATLPTGTPNPGRYISSMTWTDISGATDIVVVTSPNHSLNTGDSVTIVGAIPPEFNGTHTITSIDANSYSFGLELSYEPGDMTPAIAAAKALTPRALALSNTTRPMSLLDATFKPLVSDIATIYDEQTAACGAGCPSGQSCGSDNMCYRPSFRNLRLGFTVAERSTTSLFTARGQLIEIKDFATTWLP